MKKLSLLMIFFSALFYSQNNSGEPAKEKQSLPLLKRTPQTVNVIKPKADSIAYKMLVKKVEKPELYVMMVKKPKAGMIQIPNILSSPIKKFEIPKIDSAR